MENLNAEQIIKQMQDWCDNMCENACLKGESLNGKIHTCEICFPNTVKNALSLIKELTEENESLSDTLVRQCCENVMLTVLKMHDAPFPEGLDIFIKYCAQRDADTVKQFAEKLKENFRKYERANWAVRAIIDETAKEMVEGI